MNIPANNNAGPDPRRLGAYENHPRHFRGTSLVYPVLSRRSGGLSVGVNLSPSQKCNFNCLYCQVHRDPASPAPQEKITFSPELLEKELNLVLEMILSGEIFQFDPFRDVPPNLRRLNDIALSGDGEPTAAPEFLHAVRTCARVKDALALTSVKLTLITNSSLLDQPQVLEALHLLDRHQGEIWAKLDAGTENYYRQVNRSPVPFARILENLLQAGRQHPLIIQTLLMRINGQPPAAAEIAAYIDRLRDLKTAGAQITSVQLHTIARPPADPTVTALFPAALDQIAARMSAALDIPLQRYY